MIVDDSTPADRLFPTAFGRGLVPRDFRIHPVEMFAPPDQVPLIPRSEWSARIREQEECQGRLSDLRDWPALNQGQEGFCWAYSTTGAVMLLRSLMNQPYQRLSAHAIGCKVMGFKNQGGWCGLSAKFHREQGCPTVDYWTEGSMSRLNDTPECWQNAALHKVSEDWCDLTRPVQRQSLTFDQVASCLLQCVPCALDFNWWGHSVCGMDLVEVEPGAYGIRILNSWGDGWEDRGTSVLVGRRAIPDGAVALRVTGASPT